MLFIFCRILGLSTYIYEDKPFILYHFNYVIITVNKARTWGWTECRIYFLLLILSSSRFLG
jgi:hypothetical protein